MRPLVRVEYDFMVPAPATGDSERSHVANLRPEPSTGHALALSIAQTGYLLSVGRTSIFKLIREGELASLKIGRRRLVLRQSITEYLLRQLDNPRDSGP